MDMPVIHAQPNDLKVPKQKGRPKKTRSALCRQPGEDEVQFVFPDFAAGAGTPVPSAPSPSSCDRAHGISFAENEANEKELGKSTDGGLHELARTSLGNEEGAA